MLPCPYFTPDYSDGHLSTNGYRWYGEFVAEAIFKTQVLHSKFMSLIASNAAYDNHHVYITVENATLPLVIDTHTVEETRDYGFMIYANDTPVDIESVKIYGNEIVLTTSVDLTTFGSIGVSYAGVNLSPTRGTGNIRDNDPYIAQYTYWDDSSDTGASNTLSITYRPKDTNNNVITGQKYPMFKWLNAFYFDLDAPIIDPNNKKSDAIYENVAATSLVSITDGANGIALKALTIDIANDFTGDVKLTRSGKNMIRASFDNIKKLNGGANTWTNNKKTINGIEYTIKTDSNGFVEYIEATGEATATSILVLDNYTDVKTDTQYVLTGCTGGSNSTYGIALDFFGGCYDGEKTDTPSRSGQSCYVIVHNGVTVTSQKFYPMLRFASDTDSTYVPYNGEIYTFDEDEIVASWVTTRLGKNYFWSNAGDVALTYAADTKLYINKIVSQAALT